MANSFEIEQEAPELETLANLAENLVYRLPGCTDLMVRKTIRDVYRDFCRRSCCLHTTRRLFVEPNRTDYAVSASFGGTVDSVTEVRLGRRKLELNRDYTVRGMGDVVVVLDKWLVACAQDDKPLNIPSEPQPNETFTLPDPPPFGKPPHVHGGGPLEISVVELPLVGGEDAPRGFIAKYGDAICSGVLFRLMSMSGRAWSDAQQAQMESARYENGVMEARLNYHSRSDSGSCDQGYGFDTSDLI